MKTIKYHLSDVIGDFETNTVHTVVYEIETLREMSFCSILHC